MPTEPGAKPSAKTSPASKNERREAARQKAEAMRKEQERREARSRRITWYAVGGGLAVVIALVAFIVIRGNQLPTLAADVARPAGSSDTGGVVIGGSAAVAGQETDGAVDVVVYQDYMCPWCGVFERTNNELLSELIADGTINVTLHPVAFLDDYSEGTQYSTRTAAAFAYIVDQAPEQAWAFNAALFEEQPDENTTGLSDEEIVERAKAAGVPDDVAEAAVNDTWDPWVDAASDVATTFLQRKAGRVATPSVFVNGELIDGTVWQSTDALREAILAAK